MQIEAKQILISPLWLEVECRMSLLWPADVYLADGTPRKQARKDGEGFAQRPTGSSLGDEP